MNANLLGPVFCLVAAALSSSVMPVAAQPAPGTAQAGDELTEKQKLAILDNILVDEGSLKLPLNHATIGAAVASLLWDTDPTKARSLITGVTSQFAAQASRIDPRDPQYHQLNQQVSSARQAAAGLIARHDLGLAISFLRATRPPEGSQQIPLPGQIDAESQLELWLTSEYGPGDPTTALAMAEESLTRGISFHIVNLYLRLAGKDPDGAARLAREIVKRLGSLDLASNQEAGMVACNLISHIWQQAQAQDRARVKGSGDGDGASIRFDKENFVSLLEITAHAVVTVSRPTEGNYPASTLLRQIKGVMPAFERYLPAKVPQLRAKLSQFETLQDDQTKTWERYQSLTQSQPTTASLLEFAGTVPANQRDQFYSMIANQVLEKGDAQQAQQIITEHITSPVQRSQSLRELDQQKAVKAAARGSGTEFRTLIEAMPTDEERIVLLLRCANEAMQREDLSAARQFLDEARGLSTRSESGAGLYRRFELAEHYLRIDTGVAAEILEGVFSHLNVILGAASVLDGFEQRGAFEEDELLIANPSQWVSLLEQAGRALAMVARTDVRRADLAIGILQRPEARVAVRMGMLHALQNSACG